MVTTPTIGQTNWGPPLNAALLDLQAQIDAMPANGSFSATDQNLVAWTYDVSISTGTSAISNGGVMTISRVVLRKPATVNNIIMSLITAGAALTAGQNFAALYDSAGNRVGVTADQSANWVSTGLKTMPLAVPYAAAAGQYLVALLCNGTTAPTIHRGATSVTTNHVNAGTAGATLRFATQGAGLTAAPASFAPASMAASGTAWWVALS